jgi:hypothetical protein
MTGMDFATRAYNHSFPFDPVIRSLLDTDFYKLLMQQFIWEHYPNERVDWALTNRTRSVRLAEEIDMAELREQLDHVRGLRFTSSEIIHLRGQTFYGQSGIFKEGYLHALSGYQPPDYVLDTDREGQLSLRFEGPWWQTTLWEIYALAVVNELRSRALLRAMRRSELDILFARAKVKLYAKLERLRELPELNLTDFRHPAPARLPVAGALRADRSRSAGGALHRHLECLPGDEARAGGQGHQCPRAAHGAGGAGATAGAGRCRGAAGIAVQGAAAMAEPVSRQSAGLPADTFGTSQFL